jgi:formylglycine-generating enzyme
MMGSPEGVGFPDEHPQHRVTLPGFWIDKTEVTNERYDKFAAAIAKSGDHSKCSPDEPAQRDHAPFRLRTGGSNGPRQPVAGVDWYDAYAYAAWVGERLPTEAQWEKAARGTDGREYPWGDDWDSSKCSWSNTGQAVTVDVGSYPQGASPCGCLDMAGNVSEWCADWYAEGYYASSPTKNPPGPAEGTERVLRGGCSVNLPDYLCSAVRLGFIPGGRNLDNGFRCVVVP